MNDHRRAGFRASIVVGPLRFLRSAQPWQSFSDLAAAAVLGGGLLLLPVVIVVVGGAHYVATATLVLCLVIVLARLPLAEAARAKLGLPRSGFDGFTGAPPRVVTGQIARLRLRLGDGQIWREFAYSAVYVVIFTMLNLLLLGLALACCAFALLPIVVPGIAPDTVELGDLGALRGTIETLPFALAGLVGIVLCMYLAIGLNGWQSAVARRTLVPQRNAQAQVVELTRSRARLVSNFDDERKRIERDLHDGAQQRLLAVSLTLQLAKMELANAAGAELVQKADDEARLALAELRELIQGIHPQVLTNRGLAAAVNELAMHSKLPVSVAVVLDRRLPDQVEIAAYYMLSEALTNITKHSTATEAEIHGRLCGQMLQLTVSDNGSGGADPTSGSGLNGLADRISTLGGSLTLSSPPGGPTTLVAQIPAPPMERT